MAQDLTELKKNYGDGVISRREFIHQSAVITGSLAAATTMADALGPTAVYAAQVDPNDPALNSTMVTFASGVGTSVQAYLTRPTHDGPITGIVVIHENRGLNDHIQDVARRLAKEGYVVLAPDLLSRLGGTASFPGDGATEAIRKLNEDMLTKDLTGAID